MDRFLIFKVKDWKKKYFTEGIAAVCGLILTLAIFLINSNVIFTFGYQFNVNGTEVTQCFTTIPSTYWMAAWNNVNFKIEMVIQII